MTYSFNTNQTPATCAVAIFNLKTLLKSVGWTVPRSSDGTTYNSSGDQISSGGSGANGMDNASAWFVIQSPGATPRQLCLQRWSTVGAGTSYAWRIKYSKSAGFTGGSPGATRVPSAADEQLLLGAGTDASPTFNSLFGTATDGGFRHNLLADNADGYSFASFAWTNTAALPTHGFLFDPLTECASGDTYGLALYVNGTIASSANGGVAGAGCFQCESVFRNYGKMFGHKFDGTWSTTIVGCGLMCSNSGTLRSMSPYGLYTNGEGKDDVFKIPVIHLNTGTNFGDWRGFSTLLRWSSCARATGSTLSVSGSKDRVILCDISLPWDGSTPTV